MQVEDNLRKSGSLGGADHLSPHLHNMTTEIRVRARLRKYNWPEAQLQFWLFIMTAASATTLGIFSYFITVQKTLKVGIPWYVQYLLLLSLPLIIFTRCVSICSRKSTKQSVLDHLGSFPTRFPSPRSPFSSSSPCSFSSPRNSSSLAS